MAATANAGGPKIPNHLRLLAGRDEREDGIPTDSGGRPIPAGPAFTRANPPKPEWLSPDAEWLWDQVIEQMSVVGLLKPLDAAALEVACETFGRWKQALEMRRTQGATMETANGTRAAPWVGIEERAGKEFRAWCAEFGFTPAAERNLVGTDGGDPAGDNPF